MPKGKMKAVSPQGDLGGGPGVLPEHGVGEHLKGKEMVLKTSSGTSGFRPEPALWPTSVPSLLA